MPTVHLTETHVRGLYVAADGRLYEREDGVEERCPRCGRWSQILYKWSDRAVCGRHVRIRRPRIRVLTTFACRVYRDGEAESPPARVLRRGNTVAVAGRPEPCGRSDKFPARGGGFVLVPRSRWAWA